VARLSPIDLQVVGLGALHLLRDLQSQHRQLSQVLGLVDVCDGLGHLALVVLLLRRVAVVL